MNLQEKAQALSAQGVFLGGPASSFETVGRQQLIVLLNAGLFPSSRVVDIGCGCLRGGYWLIHFLDEDAYFGIEPDRQMLELGIGEFLGQDLCKRKRPMFDHNDRFDTSVFGVKFDFFIARSIWTHAAKAHIEAMLDSFVRDAAAGGVFLTSYLRASRSSDDYAGSDWVGRSHNSADSGCIHHSFEWIQEACRRRGLGVEETAERIVNDQVWLAIRKHPNGV